jgi:predicted molibdopterin-dependent oxidoreductase YjgC
MTFRPVAHPVVPGETPLLALSIDGTPVNARAGDTLLSVLLRARGHVRQAEFGTPVLRAGFCLMGACQDCWVSLADGERVRACTTLARAGMQIITEPGHGPA